MSYQLVDHVLKQGPDHPGDKLVLVAIASFVNVETGRCDPSMEAIAKRASMSARGARKVVRRLEQDGWIECQTGGGLSRASAYRINTERCSGFVDQNPEHCSPFATDIPGTEFRSTRNCVSQTRNVDVENPERRSAKPVKNKEGNKQGNPPSRMRARGGTDQGSSIGSDAADQMIASIIGRWPKRGGEQEARRAFAAALAEGVDPAEIARGAAAYLADRHRDPRGPAAVIQFTKPLARWLAERGWETWAGLPDADVEAATAAAAEHEALVARMREREARRRAMPF